MQRQTREILTPDRASGTPASGVSGASAQGPIVDAADGAAARAAAEATPRRRARPTRTGDHPATIESVAALAGVSTATVSRVLTGTNVVRPETRRRVEAAVATLAYVPSGPARALAGSPTWMLGLLMTDITQPFYTELARAVEAEALARGYSLILANGAGDVAREAAYLEQLAGRRVDGILVASRDITDRHLDWLRSAPVEVVLVTCEAPGAPLAAIVSASHSGEAAAAEHVLALGHRVLGVISGPAASASSQERREGAVSAAQAAGLPASAVVAVPSSGDVAGGRSAAATLLARTPRPTAILCYNDLVAVGALHALADAGLSVPGDVSVVGFDDVPVAAMVSPALTTVAQAVDDMARWAVERLAAQIEARRAGDEAPAPEVVRHACRLVVRASTGPAPE